MDTTTTVILVILLSLVSFAVFWCFVIWLISRISGWSKLALHYRSDTTFLGPRWRFQYIMVGWAGYNGVMTVGADSYGLYLVPLAPFRIGHAPLLIPWGDITAEEVSARFFAGLALSIRQVPSIKVRISKRLGERILAAKAGQILT